MPPVFVPFKLILMKEWFSRASANGYELSNRRAETLENDVLDFTVDMEPTKSSLPLVLIQQILLILQGFDTRKEKLLLLERFRYDSNDKLSLRKNWS
ncbi:MAG: hypothetical protein IPN88_11780 [Bacteroidetes bacterium]|nr:hypothetical protein [Bacteroidota bacterium]